MAGRAFSGSPRFSPYQLPDASHSLPSFWEGSCATSGTPDQQLDPCKKKPGAIFRCTYEGCQATFGRDEHLTRHERIHSQERPFHCSLGDCDKWFSRLDNVRQHFKSIHRLQIENGEAEKLMQHMLGLQKQLSAAAAARRKLNRVASTDSLPKNLSSDSLPSVRSLRLSPTHFTPDLVPSESPSDGTPCSSTKSSPPHHFVEPGPRPARQQSAPAYVHSMHGHAAQTLPLSYRHSYYASQDNFHLMTPQTQTLPGPLMPIPRSDHHMVANGKDETLPMPIYPVAPFRYGDNEQGSQIVSPTSAFFNIVMNGPPPPVQQAGIASNWCLGDTQPSQGVGDQPQHTLGEAMPGYPTVSNVPHIQRPPVSHRRPSSSTLNEYMLVPASVQAPTANRDDIADFDSIPSPTTALDAGGDRNMLGQMVDERIKSRHLAVHSSTVETEGHSAAAFPMVASTIPRLSPAIASPRRFEGLAAAFGSD